jgi:hypothetical protein
LCSVAPSRHNERTVADFDTNELLLANGVITRDVLDRAAKLPSDMWSSRVGRLVSAGADGARMLEALSRLTGIPLATKELLEWATPTLMLPSTARQLRDILACPVKRDEKGCLHVVIADPEAARLVDKLLIDYKVYLAPDDGVKTLLDALYAMGPTGSTAVPQSQGGDAIEIDLEASRQNVRSPPPDAIEIDMEASQRMTAAPGAQPKPVAMTISAAVAADPFAARPSGKMKRPQDDEPTQRIQRSPATKKPAPASADTTQDMQFPLEPVAQPPMSIVDEQTMVDSPSPSSTLRAATRRAFWNGVAAGAGVMAVIASIVVVALMTSR